MKTIFKMCTNSSVLQDAYVVQELMNLQQDNLHSLLLQHDDIFTSYNYVSIESYTSSTMWTSVSSLLQPNGYLQLHCCYHHENILVKFLLHPCGYQQCRAITMQIIEKPSCYKYMDTNSRILFPPCGYLYMQLPSGYLQPHFCYHLCISAETLPATVLWKSTAVPYRKNIHLYTYY